MSHSNQILDRNTHRRIGSAIGEKLNDILYLVDDRFQKPLEVSFDNDTITIAAGIVQTVESNEIGGFQNSYRYGLSPMTGDENKPVESTLNVQTGVTTGDFQVVSAPSMDAGNYVRMGIELRTDGKFYVIFGDEGAILDDATYPKFAVGGSIQILVMNLKDDGSGGMWNFLPSVKEDIIILFNSSTGGGSSNAKLIEGGLWDVVSTFISSETIDQPVDGFLLLSWQNPTDMWGQSFTPSANGFVQSITLDLTRAGSPDADVVVELMTVVAGLPDTLLASKSIHSSLVSGPTVFTFDTPVPVVGSNQYCFVVRYENVILVDATNRYLVYGSSTDTYANGTYLENTGAWTQYATEDVSFLVGVVVNKYELTWDEDAYISYPGLQPERNTILADSVQLEIGQAAYVKIHKLPGVDSNLTVFSGFYQDIDPYDASIVIFARSVTDGVVVGSSFLLEDGVSKYLDAGLSEENKSLLGSIKESTSLVDYTTYGSPERNIDSTQNIPTAIASLDTELDKFFGQLKIIPHESDLNKARVTGADFTMKDSSILSQEIASLLMKFDGAVIDFTTGEIFESDGATPLGVNFTPATIPASEYCWYSIGMVANTITPTGDMTVQLIVLAGTPNVDPDLATIPSFAGSKKIGLVRVQNQDGTLALSQLVGGSTIKLIDYIGSLLVNKWAQSFTLPSDTDIFSVDVELRKDSTTEWLSGVVNVHLFASTGTLPSTLIATSSRDLGVVDDLGTVFTLYNFGFSSPVSLSAGTQYWIVIDTSGVTGNFSGAPGDYGIYINGTSTNPYAGGNAAINPTGSWFNQANYDLVFKLYSSAGGLSVNSIRQLGAGSGSGGGGPIGKLVAGGEWTVTSPDTLSWSEDAYVVLPGLQFARNTIPSGSIALNPNEVAYVKLNSLAGVDDDLTVYSDNIQDVSPYDSSIYIFARNVGGEFIVGGASTKILPNTRRQLEDNSDLVFFIPVTFDEVVESSVVFESDTIVSANARINGNVTFKGAARIKKGAVIYGNVFADDSETDIYIETGVNIFGSIVTERILTIDSSNSTADESVVISGDVQVGDLTYVWGTSNRYHTLTVLGDLLTGAIDIATNTSTSADMLNLNIAGTTVCKGHMYLGGSTSNLTVKQNIFNGDVIVDGDIRSEYEDTAKGSHFIANGNVICGGFSFRKQNTITGNSNMASDAGKIEIYGDLKVTIGDLSLGHHSVQGAYKFYGNVYVNGDVEIYGATNTTGSGSVIFSSNLKIIGDLNFRLYAGTSAGERMDITCNGEVTCGNISKQWEDDILIFYIGGSGIVKARSINFTAPQANDRVQFQSLGSESRPAIEIWENINSSVALHKSTGVQIALFFSGEIRKMRYNWDDIVSTPILYGKDYSNYDVIVDADGGGDYTSLGVALASIGENTTVFVRNGEYSLNSVTALQHGTRIIGESVDGVRITLSQYIQFPSHLTSVLRTRRINGPAFDDTVGLGMLTFLSGFTCTYSGNVDPVIGQKIFISGSWYNIDDVDTPTKTITVNKRIFTNNTIPVPYAVCSSSIDIEDSQNIKPCLIENLTFVNNQSTRCIYMLRNIGGKISNVKFIAGDSVSFGGNAIAITDSFQLELDSVSAIGETSNITSFGFFLHTQGCWYSKFTNLNCRNVSAMYLQNTSTADMTVYRCTFEFSEMNGNYGIYVPFGIMESRFKLDKVDTVDFCNTSSAFYKCKFEIGILRSYNATVSIRGNANEFHFTHINLPVASGILRLYADYPTNEPNKIITGKITCRQFYANGLWIDTTVDLSDVEFILGTFARIPAPDKYDAIVDINGTGTHKSIREAALNYDYRKIFIKDGIYQETDLIYVRPGQKLHGESRDGVIIKAPPTGYTIQLPRSSSFQSTRPTSDNTGFNPTSGHGVCDVVRNSRTVTYTGPTDPVATRSVFIEGNWFEIVSVDSGLKTFELDREWLSPSQSGLPFVTLLPFTIRPETNPEQYTEIKNLTIETSDANNAHLIYADSAVRCRISNININNRHFVSPSKFAMVLSSCVDVKIDNVRMTRLIEDISTGTCSPFWLYICYYCDITNTDVYDLVNGNISGSSGIGPIYKCNFEFGEVHSVNFISTTSFIQKSNFKIREITATNIMYNTSGGLSHCNFEFGKSIIANGTYISGLGNTLDVDDYYGRIDFNCGALTPSGENANAIRSGRFHGTLGVGGTSNVIIDIPVQVETLEGVPILGAIKPLYFVTVDPSGLYDYTSISDAVGYSPPGTTIFIKNGEYTETAPAYLKHGQKIIGESRDGVRIIVSSSLTQYFNNSAVYDSFVSTQSNNGGYDADLGFGTLSVVSGSAIATYTGIGTAPIAGRHACIEGSWFEIISVDTIGKTIELDRHWSGPSASGLPWIQTNPANLSVWNIVADPNAYTSIENLTYIHNHTSGKFISVRDCHNLKLKRLTVINNTMATMDAILINQSLGLDIDDITLIGDTDTQSTTRLVFNGTSFSNIRNISGYNAGNLILNTSTFYMTYKCNFHFLQVYTNTVFITGSYVYNCEFKIDNIRTTQVSTTNLTGNIFNCCKFIFGDISCHVAAVSSLNGVGNEFHFGCKTNIGGGLQVKNIGAVVDAPTNIFVDGHLNVVGTLYIDSDAWLGNMVDISYGALDGVWGREPLPKIESINDLNDVDTSTVPPEEGQALVWNGVDNFIPGASGDSSFKFQSITGTDLTIKQGYLILNDGRELRLASDLVYDLSGITVDGNYYGSIDLYTLPQPTLVNGREIHEITSSNIVFDQIRPEDKNLSRYVPLGCVQRSAGVWENQVTLAVRRHDIALGADASLEYTRTLGVVGNVGDVGQIRAGHILGVDSFPSGADVSFYNLSTYLDNSANLRNLSVVGGLSFSSNGIMGVANTAATFDGTPKYLTSTDPDFDPGDSDFSFGAWFHRTNWEGIAVPFFEQSGGGKYAFFLSATSSDLSVYTTVDGSTENNSTFSHGLTGSGWHHIAFVYDSGDDFLYCYVDGVVVGVHNQPNGIYQIGASRTLFIGGSPAFGVYFNGRMDELFLATEALTDGDIRKIYSSKLTHGRTISPQNQKWFGWTKSGDVLLPYSGYITHMDVNDLYASFDNFSTTDEVELKLYNGSSVGLSKPSKSKTLELTASALDALLPITHGLGVVPELTFKVFDGADYEYHDEGSVFVANATQIKLSGSSLATLYGGATKVILNYSSGTVAQFVPDKLWNSYVASASQPLLVNDKVLADSSGGTITLTLPGSPVVGDEVQIFDYDGSWSLTNRVDLAGGGHNIMGAATYELTVANSAVRVVFNGTEWRVY